MSENIPNDLCALTEDSELISHCIQSAQGFLHPIAPLFQSKSVDIFGRVFHRKILSIKIAIIMKTYLYNFDPLKPPLLYSKTGVHRAEAVLTSTHNLCFKQKYENYQNFLSENFQFLVVKFSIYLNRRVFVMVQACEGRVSSKVYLLVNISSKLGPNIHWTSKYGTGIVFIGNMLSWLSFHNFVWWSLNAHISVISPNIWDLFSKSNSSIYYL